MITVSHGYNSDPGGEYTRRGTTGVATALAELIIGGLLASVPLPAERGQDGRDAA
jgi:hypothetical protein